LHLGIDLRVIAGNCTSTISGNPLQNFTVLYWNETSEKAVLAINSSIENNTNFALYYNNSNAIRTWNISDTFYQNQRFDMENETLYVVSDAWSGGNVSNETLGGMFFNKYANSTESMAEYFTDALVPPFSYDVDIYFTNLENETAFWFLGYKDTTS
jgi:hypothetical protein